MICHLPDTRAADLGREEPLPSSHADSTRIGHRSDFNQFLKKKLKHLPDEIEGRDAISNLY